MQSRPVLFIMVLISLFFFAGCIVQPPEPSGPAFPVTPQTAKVHLVAGVDADFPPFISQDRSGNFSGLDVDALKWIADRKGVEISYSGLPWDTAFDALESGKVDFLASGVTITPAREARANFTLPYYAKNMGIAARNRSQVTMQDLYNGRLTVGVQKGSTDVTWVHTTLIATGKMPEANLFVYSDIITMTRALEDGEVDVTIAQALAQQNVIGGRSLVIIGTTPEDEKVAYAVRKNDTALKSLLDDGLVQLLNDPYWEQLKQKYHLT